MHQEVNFYQKSNKMVRSVKDGYRKGAYNKTYLSETFKKEI